MSSDMTYILLIRRLTAYKGDYYVIYSDMLNSVIPKIN